MRDALDRVRVGKKRAAIAALFLNTHTARSMPQNLRQKVLRLIGLRVVEEVVRIVLFDDLALVHEDHSVGDGFGEAHFVRDAEHGDALIGHRDHYVQHFFTHLWVKR